MQFEKDMESKHKALFLKARKFLLVIENVIENKKKRITTYSTNSGGLCHVRTMEYGIDIGFLKGAKMNDKYGLLTGNGKVMRVLPLRMFDKEIVAYYIDQAIDLSK